MAGKHDVTPYKGHFGLYLVGCIVAVLIFAGCAILASSHQATGWEYAWFTTINSWPDTWYRAMTIITFFGSAWIAVAGVVGAFVAKFYRLAGRLALSILLTYAAVLLTKELLARPRPDLLFGDVQVRFAETASSLTFSAGTMGFPSLHAATATVIGLTLMPYIRRRWQWIVPLGILLVGISRIYLGVHIPLDIVAGVAIGTAVAAGIRVMPQPLRVLLRID